MVDVGGHYERVLRIYANGSLCSAGFYTDVKIPAKYDDDTYCMFADVGALDLPVNWRDIQWQFSQDKLSWFDGKMTAILFEKVEPVVNASMPDVGKQFVFTDAVGVDWRYARCTYKEARDESAGVNS